MVDIEETHEIIYVYNYSRGVSRKIFRKLYKIGDVKITDQNKFRFRVTKVNEITKIIKYKLIRSGRNIRRDIKIKQVNTGITSDNLAPTMSTFGTES